MNYFQSFFIKDLILYSLELQANLVGLLQQATASPLAARRRRGGAASRLTLSWLHGTTSAYTREARRSSAVCYAGQCALGAAQAADKPSSIHG